MSNSLSSSLTDLLREHAVDVPVARFREAGRQSVRVLSRARIEQLVTVALMRTLEAASLTDEQREEIQTAAHLETMRLLARNSDLERVAHRLQQEKAALQRNLKQLEVGLRVSEQELREAERRATEDGREEIEARLVAKLDELVEAAASTARQSPEEAEQAVIELGGSLKGRLLADFRASIDDVHKSAANDEEVEILRRRVQKLNASLDEAQGAMRELQSNQGGSSDGIASVYREAQGLRGTEPEYDQRMDLMKQIFDLNRRIKTEVDEEWDSAAVEQTAEQSLEQAAVT